MEIRSNLKENLYLEVSINHTQIIVHQKVYQVIIQNRLIRMGLCSKPNDDYKREISSQYVIGQVYNKSGLQVLTKKETLD